MAFRTPAATARGMVNPIPRDHAVMTIPNR